MGSDFWEEFIGLPEEISEEEANYYSRVIKEFEAASSKGNASIKVEGKLIDYAMYNKAKSLVERFSNKK